MTEMTNPEHPFTVPQDDIDEALSETKVFIPREREFIITEDTSSLQDYASYIWYGNHGKNMFYNNTITDTISESGFQTIIGTKLHWYPRETAIATTCFRLITTTGDFDVFRDYQENTPLSKFDIDSEESKNDLDEQTENELENLSRASPSDWDEFQRFISSGRRHFEAQRRKPRLVRGIERASNRLTAYLAHKL